MSNHLVIRPLLNVEEGDRFFVESSPRAFFQLNVLAISVVQPMEEILIGICIRPFRVIILEIGSVAISGRIGCELRSPDSLRGLSSPMFGVYDFEPVRSFHVLRYFPFLFDTFALFVRLRVNVS